MKNLEIDEFDEIIDDGGKKVILFYADWCLYCKKFKPLFETEEHNFQKINYSTYEAKINDDDNPLWDRFNIDVVPTVIIFEGDKIINRKDARMGVGLTKNDLFSLLKN